MFRKHRIAAGLAESLYNPGVIPNQQWRVAPFEASTFIARHGRNPSSGIAILHQADYLFRIGSANDYRALWFSSKCYVSLRFHIQGVSVLTSQGRILPGYRKKSNVTSTL